MPAPPVATLPALDPARAVIDRSPARTTLAQAAPKAPGGMARRRHLVPGFKARTMSTFGAVVFVAGLVVVALVAHELWISNWLAERNQKELAAEFDALLETTPVIEDDPTIQVPVVAEEQVPEPPPEVSPVGDIVAKLTFESLGQETIVVSGTTVPSLKTGPGWMHGTAFPGDPGNSVISGHRTTYGAPFHDLHLLNVGDRIRIQVPGRNDAVYEVRDSFIVGPKDVYVTAGTAGARLTLTTCHPIGSARQRLIIQAELIEGDHADVAVPAGEWHRSVPG